MKKELLKKENIIKDMISYEKELFSQKDLNYKKYIYPYLFSAVLCFLCGNFLIYVGIVLVLVAVVALLFYYPVLKEHKRRLKLIESGDIYVSKDTLKNIVTETVREANFRSRRMRSYKEITSLYFSSTSWRLPGKAYQWSELYNMSKKGIENTSIIGDEFYLAANKEDYTVSCVYNAKFFRLDEKELKADE